MPPNYTPKFIDRFWAKVDRSGECWNWTAARVPKGYGQIGYQNEQGRGAIAYAHRVSYELYYGPIPDGMFVCHRCDNPSCVRPAHLFLGTHNDNMADSVRKGRGRTQKHPEQQRGERNGRAKLTEDQVKEIRQVYAGGKITQEALACQFCVSRDTIWSVLKGDTWGHVPIT